MTTKNQNQAKKVTGMEVIPFVTADAAAGVDGFVVSEDGLTALVEASFLAETVAALTAARDSAVTAQQTAERNLATANATITANTTRITELEAQLEEAMAGADEFEEPVRKKDPTGKTKVAFHDDPKNPINAFADKMMGAPGKRKVAVDEEEEE